MMEVIRKDCQRKTEYYGGEISPMLIYGEQKNLEEYHAQERHYLQIQSQLKKASTLQHHYYESLQMWPSARVKSHYVSESYMQAHSLQRNSINANLHGAGKK